MLFVRRMVIHGKTMRPLIASCLAVVGLVFLAMTRLATSLPLAIAGTGLVLFGPLLLPFATFSWTPQNTSFVLLSTAIPAVSAAAYISKPKRLTCVLAVFGFFVWCLCGFAIVGAGY